MLAERPPSAWPDAVRTLVKQREAAAAEVRRWRFATCFAAVSLLGRAGVVLDDRLSYLQSCRRELPGTGRERCLFEWGPAVVQASALAARKEAAAAEAVLESELREATEAAEQARAGQRKAEAARWAHAAMQYFEHDGVASARVCSMSVCGVSGPPSMVGQLLF